MPEIDYGAKYRADIVTKNAAQLIEKLSVPTEDEGQLQERSHMLSDQLHNFNIYLVTPKIYYKDLTIHNQFLQFFQKEPLQKIFKNDNFWSSFQVRITFQFKLPDRKGTQIEEEIEKLTEILYNNSEWANWHYFKEEKQWEEKKLIDHCKQHGFGFSQYIGDEIKP